ncbi:MAG: transposase [Planctomycetaceae bacterium]|nr:transposase [Planctomycetaceae bacterium]
MVGFLCCQRTRLSAQEIIERYGVRFGIEEVFKDLKEVWSWGKQEVRKLESSKTVTATNMMMYCLRQPLTTLPQ